MSTLAKPKMRGLHVQYIRKSIISATITVAVFGVLYKFLVMDARKKQYEKFYKTYDDEAQLKIMQEAGLMQSYPIK